MGNTIENRGKPTILLAGPLPPPAGGISTIVSELLQSELQNDFQIIHFRNSSKRPRSKKGMKDPLINIFLIYPQLLSFFLALIRHNPDIIQIESSIGGSFLKNSLFVLIAKFFSRVVIFTMHAEHINFERFYSGSPVFMKKYIKFILNSCDAIKLIYEGWIHTLVDTIGVSRRKIFIVPNFINLNNFFEEVYENKKGKPIILYVGNIGQRKGVFDFILCAEALKNKGYDFSAICVGPQFRKGDLKKAIDMIAEKKMSDYIIMANEISRSETIRYYKMADIFVLPSYSECFPLSILEAMAAGLPIISTPVGAIREIVEENTNGFLIKPGAVEKFVEKIEILLNDKRLRKFMGINNKSKIKSNYSLNKIAQKYTNLYNLLLAQSFKRRSLIGN